MWKASDEMPVQDIKDVEAFEKVAKDAKAVVHFWAEWAEQCKQMDDILNALYEMHQGKVKFCRVEAEEVDALSQRFSISAVPTVVVLNRGVEVGRVNGIDPVGLTQQVEKLARDDDGEIELASNSVVETLDQQLHRLTHKSGIVLFMKGNPKEPKCKFSRATMELLKDVQSDIMENDQFGFFNILEDEEVRQGLKEYSKWPTYPQLFVNGELVGGLDVMKELHENAELVEMFNEADSEKTKLKWLTHRAPIMLFMKGSPDEPKCGFSRKMIALMQDACLDFEHFDILSDDAVRQGLKTYSNWPTFPQLYSKGELVGGLDVCKELHENDELRDLGKTD